jgi:hypothetical protein
VLYLLADENQPTLSTTQRPDSDLATVRTISSQPFQELINARPDLVGQTVSLEYGPRGGQRRTFTGVLKADGVEVVWSCYHVWEIMQEILKREHGIRWKLPADVNPDAIFD